MALVITVAQQKGGAGKTMLAANLAARWAGSRRVVLLDIDPQKSLMRWHQIRSVSLPTIGFSDVSGWRLAGEIDKLQKTADVLIVDTPPHIDTDAARAIRAASLILIPIQPSMPDFWAADGTLKLAETERRKVALLLNRSPAKSRLKTAIEAEIAKRGLHLLPVILGNRSAYPQAFAQGLGVTEAVPRSLAAAEFSALADAVDAITR